MVYRNQTNTITQITNLSHMRITTVQEAVAFLRAIQPLQEQVANVLQRASVMAQHSMNRAVAPTPAPVVETPASPVEPDKPFEPEEMDSDEGYSDKEVKEKVNKLKKAKNAKKANESDSEEKGN